MDFENYTIGRLIPNRENYDDKNPDYVQVRAKIERRMFDLGYRAESFKEADMDIGNLSWNTSDQTKVDRYGKRYSWIAYFEMWGEREVAKKLPNWCLGKRTPDCGVDPSFPKCPPDWMPSIPDLFGSPSISTESWVEDGFTPQWESLLVVPEINGNSGDWVLLEGFIRGAEEIHDREIFAFLRGVFIARKDVSSLRNKFLAVNFPVNNEIPEGATEYYLYTGEAGRRQNYAQMLCQRTGRYHRQTVRAFDQYLYEHPMEKTSGTSVKIRSTTDEGNEAGISLAELIVPFPRTTLVPGIRLELPFIHFGWEPYHSSHNDFSGFNLPAPSLIQRLGLANKNREIDFYDPTGKLGTLYREAGMEIGTVFCISALIFFGATSRTFAKFWFGVTGEKEIG